MAKPDDLSIDTLLVAASRPRRAGDPLNAPLIAASNFELSSLPAEQAEGDGHPGGEIGRAYARDDGTATWASFEGLVGALEAGEAVAFASGMAAAAAVFAQLPVGATIVWPEDCYQGITEIVRAGVADGRWSARRLAADDTAAWIEAAGEADLLWLESPSNPLLVVADLAAILGAERKPSGLAAVDNTLAGPLLQQPLDLGADLSMQSATKHLGGHSDLLLGVTVTRRGELAARLRHQREIQGATPGALEAFLATRGVRTLGVRHERAQANAVALASRLAEHSGVETVRYPGLASHPTHRHAKEQMRGYGTVISFDVTGGAERADAVCRDLRLIRNATSFGAVESTVERRAAVPGQEHLPPGLLRLSVGIEGLEDLWRDLDRALRIG